MCYSSGWFDSYPWSYLWSGFLRSNTLIASSFVLRLSLDLDSATWLYVSDLVSYKCREGVGLAPFHPKSQVQWSQAFKIQFWFVEHRQRDQTLVSLSVPLQKRILKALAQLTCTRMSVGPHLEETITARLLFFTVSAHWSYPNLAPLFNCHASKVVWIS